MNRVFYFTKNTYQNGVCSDIEFFATADEAVAAAEKDWSNLCAADKKDHVITACICVASAERIAEVMEREGWETAKDAAESLGYDFLAVFEENCQKVNTLLIADTINGVMEVSDISEFCNYDGFSFMSEYWFKESLKDLSDDALIAAVVTPEEIAEIQEIYGIIKE